MCCWLGVDKTVFVRPLDFEMESEIIYEANGEFSPIISFSENNNISSNTVDKECFQPPDDNIENMQSLFSQGMTGTENRCYLMK